MDQNRSSVPNQEEFCQLCGAKLPARAQAAHYPICRALFEGDAEGLKSFSAKQRRIETVRRIKALTKNREPIPNTDMRTVEEPLTEAEPVVIDLNQEKFEQMMTQAGRPGSARRH